MEQSVSKYQIFCKVVESGSFTSTAKEIGYSQPAVSQIIKSLEQEMGTELIIRKRDRLKLSADGEVLYPYIRAAAASEEAIHRRLLEMKGLENTVIRIGSFTSVSRSLLPRLMHLFRMQYPSVHFVLKQGTYTEIQDWLSQGVIDFGFNNKDAVNKSDFNQLYKDEMLAVLPPNHPLAAQKTVTLNDLSKQPFILLDEGEYSATLHAFEIADVHPHVEYTVYDDYSIMAMVRQGLGVSMLYRQVVSGFENGLEVRPVKDMPKRTIGIVSNGMDTMSLASRTFVSFIFKQAEDLIEDLSI